MKRLTEITRHELTGFFSAPTGMIFLGVFLLATLFDFFWVETFFARNIADVRPLFESMPVLMIFLAAAITMRLWTEERRAGTLELLLTSPVSPWTLVTAKFLACMALVGLALLLTLPLPLTVAWIADLDWGPVVGGYLATLALAAAYIAIGLCISARSDNPIVSLILTSLVCGLFYLVGSNTLTDLLPIHVAEWFREIGTGARFDSITRGVVDLRDIVYYLTLVAVFLSLNVLALEKLRWQGMKRAPRHRQRVVASGLVALNLLFVNVPLSQLDGLRLDLTEGHLYTLSPATHRILAELKEPLLIRGYFSAQTHPLLAPLVPRLRDLLEEYAIAGDGRVRVEIVDPHEDPEIEREAGQRYGIRPVPFQTANRYQTAVVNSYFDIVVSYGDQFETLGFRDLIDIKARNETDVQVDLRNPEYDITRAIKKAVQSYQGAGNLFASLPDGLVFHGYISDDARLPERLRELRHELEGILRTLEDKSHGRLTAEFEDPDQGDGGLARRLREDHGFRPMTTSLFDDRRFWFYMVLEAPGRVEIIPLPADLEAGTLRRSIKAALKRFSRGFLKTIAVVAPKGNPAMARFGMAPETLQFSTLRDRLEQDYSLVDTDLKDGHVPAQTDLLLLLAPRELDDRQLLAVDQFLMQGGTVVAAASPFKLGLRGRLSAEARPTGLEDWLADKGLELPQRFVLDPRNSAFPVPIQRNIGGFIIQEAQLVDYPFFVDIRRDGMDRSSGLLSGIEQLTMSWASPLGIDLERNRQRRITRLLRSSPDSWTTDEVDLQPDFERYGRLGFPMGSDRGPQVLAVSITGRFDSYFKDRPVPKPPADDAAKDGEDVKKGDTPPRIERLIEHSPESARLVLIGSSSFASDQVLDLVSNTLGTRYLAPVEFLQNAVDWSLEDRSLLALRSGRARFARILPPLDKAEQQFWEYLDYGLAALGLLIVWLYRHLFEQTRRRRYVALLSVEH